jgi:hypothetical protein
LGFGIQRLAMSSSAARRDLSKSGPKQILPEQILPEQI